MYFYNQRMQFFGTTNNGVHMYATGVKNTEILSYFSSMLRILIKMLKKIHLRRPINIDILRHVKTNSDIAIGIIFATYT